MWVRIAKLGMAHAGDLRIRNLQACEDPESSVQPGGSDSLFVMWGQLTFPNASMARDVTEDKIRGLPKDMTYGQRNKHGL